MRQAVDGYIAEKVTWEPWGRGTESSRLEVSNCELLIVNCEFPPKARALPREFNR